MFWYDFVLFAQKTLMNSAKKIMVGLFKDAEKAELAYKTIQEMGYLEDEQNLILSDGTLERVKNDDRLSSINSKAMKGIGKDIAVGIAPGHKESIDTPAGILAGGLQRILHEWGFTDDTAKFIEEKVKAGEVLLGVYPKKIEDVSLIEQIWQTNSGTLINKE
jgi:hypothetical protein